MFGTRGYVVTLSNEFTSREVEFLFDGWDNRGIWIFRYQDETGYVSHWQAVDKFFN